MAASLLFSRLRGKARNEPWRSKCCPIRSVSVSRFSCLSDRFPQTFKEVEREIANFMLRNNSDTVPNLLGVTSEDNKHPSLVLKLMHKGSLAYVLATERSKLTWQRRVGIAHEAALCLLSLHQGKTPLLHRDVKSGNFLVDSDYHVRIGDLGSACSLAEAKGAFSRLVSCFRCFADLLPRGEAACRNAAILGSGAVGLEEG